MIPLRKCIQGTLKAHPPLYFNKKFSPPPLIVLIPALQLHELLGVLLLQHHDVETYLCGCILYGRNRQSCTIYILNIYGDHVIQYQIYLEHDNEMDRTPNVSISWGQYHLSYKLGMCILIDTKHFIGNHHLPPCRWLSYCIYIYFWSSLPFCHLKTIKPFYMYYLQRYSIIEPKGIPPK